MMASRCEFLRRVSWWVNAPRGRAPRAHHESLVVAEKAGWMKVSHDTQCLEILPRDPGMVPKKPLFWRINPNLSSF